MSNAAAEPIRLDARLAHDIGNQLAIIIGFTDLLLEGLQPTDIRYQDLQQIHSAAQTAIDRIAQSLAQPTAPSI